MLYVTTNEIQDFKIRATMGLCSGTSARSRHVGSDLVSGLKSVVGGEQSGYVMMIEETRSVAIKKMIENATELGANAIVGVRFTSSEVAQGVSELTVYGTGVYGEFLDDTND